jgi:hypothetical protein
MATSTRPITVERYQGDLDDQNRATAQTVGLMAEQIRQCAKDPAVQAAARNALVKYSQGRGGAYAACWAAWWSIRHTLKFVSDDSILQNIPTPNPPELELLVSPSVMVRSRNPQGDCDDFTMLMCCFLQCLGVPWEIVTVAADPGDAQRWSHVYAVAVLEDGRRMPMDAAPPDAKWPGWEVPPDHILRYQAWDQDGQSVERERPIKRMQGYIRGRGWSGMGAVPRTRFVRRRRGMRGLGDACLAYDDDGDCIASSSSAASTTVTATNLSSSSGGDSIVEFSDGTSCILGSAQCPIASSSSGSGLPTTTGSGWQNELNSLLNSWTQIGSRVIAPTTTYTGPNGVTITTPASSTAASALLSSSGIGGLSTGTILLLAGAAVLLMVFASKR